MQKILIVEDDRDIAANIADYLQGVDPTLSVVVKHEGFDGFSAAATDESVALAVLDIGLPGLDGLSLTRRLREIGWKKAHHHAYRPRYGAGSCAGAGKRGG